MEAKFSRKSIVLVTGGCMSGLGKGVTTASIARILNNSEYNNVTAIKIDPYINASAGTISPDEHGEVFVLADGTEVDLDLGSYERYIGFELDSSNSITTGKVYRSVLQKEASGEFLGQTIQTIPHVRDEVLNMIHRAITSKDVAVIELGGTIGDIESEIYLEAFSVLRSILPKNNFLHVHVTLLPGPNGESQKTKPTQHSLSNLTKHCLQPDMLVCRTCEPVSDKTRSKLISVAPFVKQVISLHNIEKCDRRSMIELFTSQFARMRLTSSYNNIIQSLLKEKSELIRDASILSCNATSEEKTTTSTIQRRRVFVVGKYTRSSDAYLSLIKAIESAASHLNINPQIELICSETGIGEDFLKIVTPKDCVIVPGGFGERGTEGKIEAIRFCRENKIPFLGICLGMQLMAIEAYRAETGDNTANSAEFYTGESTVHVVKHMSDIPENVFSGAMRLGEKTTSVKTTSSKLYDCYKSVSFKERHRHRYEVDPRLVASSILRITGVDLVTGVLVEVLEAADSQNHPFFVGVQFHPEFTSSDDKPSPLFVGLLKC